MIDESCERWIWGGVQVKADGRAERVGGGRAVGDGVIGVEVGLHCPSPDGNRRGPVRQGAGVESRMEDEPDGVDVAEHREEGSKGEAGRTGLDRVASGLDLKGLELDTGGGEEPERGTRNAARRPPPVVLSQREDGDVREGGKAVRALEPREELLGLNVE